MEELAGAVAFSAFIFAGAWILVEMIRNS